MAQNAGRRDFDAMFKIASIPSDEPVFLLRGQNATAAETVRDWVGREQAGGTAKAVLEQALRQADAMDGWPVKKFADADHLSEADQLQLAYAFDRRNWRGAIDAEAEFERLVEIGARAIYADAFKGPAAYDHPEEGEIGRENCRSSARACLLAVFK